MSVQDNWRWCRNCEGLFFAGNSLGECPRGGEHVLEGSGNYAIWLGEEESHRGQVGWRWCRKCQGLFFGRNDNASVGCCLAGGHHDPTTSGLYTVALNDSAAPGQSGWRWCHKCEGLFFGRNENFPVGRCPAGGAHEPTSGTSVSGSYTLAISSTIDTGAYRIYDVSPDMPYGVYDGSQNTGGKIITVVSDPRDPNIVYAASELAGVWKTNNGGRLWSQASRDIQTSQSLSTGPVLAVDPVNTSRLAYITAAEDYRAVGRKHWGGLYISQDAASTWTHVDLPSAPKGPVCFGRALDGSHALVLTEGGIYISTDESLTQWQLVPNPQPSASEAGVVPSYIATKGTLSGEPVFAAAGRIVYRSTLSALLNFVRNPEGLPNPWTSGRALGLELPVGCDIWRLVIAPTVPSGGALQDQVLALYLRPRPQMCPAGGDHDSTGSGDYSLALNYPDAPGQPRWNFCKKCYGLFFADQTPASRCPAGGHHQGHDSGNYTVRQGAPANSEQEHWKWCRKCQGLYFAGNASHCPAGESHDGRDSGPYGLTLNDPNPNTQTHQTRWKWCRKCQGLFFGGAPPYAVTYEVSVLNFTQRTRSDLYFLDNLNDSGSHVLAAARPVSTIGEGSTPGRDYDVFASNTHVFFQYMPDGTWKAQPGLHVDSWSFAFPATYDPPRGNYTAYAAHDGGISVRTGNPAQPWVTAMNGLHALNSVTMTGVSGLDDTLYVPTAHNEAWVSTRSGRPDGTVSSWRKIGTLGDIGQTYLDPALPSEVAFGRNKFLQVYSGSLSGTYLAINDEKLTLAEGGSSSVVEDFSPDGLEPPGAERFSQILTLPGEDPGELADYVTVGPLMVRSRDGGRRWRNILSPTALTPEELRSIKAIATAGGHRMPTIYILIAIPGDPNRGTEAYRYIKKGVIDSTTGQIHEFRDVTGSGATGRPIKPAHLTVNPYNPAVVYTIDLNDSTIKFTQNGGNSWEQVPQLTAIATDNGEYAFAFQRDIAIRRLGPLQQVIFSRDDPNFRIAILFPGGVAFSRDPAGQQWTRIDDNLQGVGTLNGVRRLSDLIAHPYSGFLSQYQGRDRLYLALFGRGVVRIDGPFTVR